MSDANTVGSILYDVYTLGQIYKHVLIFSICIGPRMNVGQGQCQEIFYGPSVRRSEGTWVAKGIVGRRMADGGWRMADGGRTEVFTSF